MSTTTPEAMQLLGLLQSRGEWTLSALAEELRLSLTRTRHRIEDLRAQGYAIEAATGPGGGYRLVAGDDTPPLVLGDQEMVAAILALRRAVASPSPLVEESTLRALVQLEQLAPARVLAAVEAHADPATTASATLRRTLAAVIEGVRSSLVLACRDRLDPDHSAWRWLEPMVLRVSAGQWYLMAYDRGKGCFEPFAISQLEHVAVTTTSFRPRPSRPQGACAVPPGRPSPVVAIVEFQAPAARVRAALPEGVGFVEPIDDESCRVLISGEGTGEIARHLVVMPEVFTVIEPAELRTEIRAIGSVLAGA